MFRTTNGGLSWDSLTTPTTFDLFSIFFVNPRTGWSVGTAGQILKTTDGGSTWSFQNSDLPTPRPTLFSVFFVDSLVGFASGANGAVIRTVNGGDDWTMLPSVTTNILYSAGFANADVGWVVGKGGTILRTDNGSVVPPPPPPQAGEGNVFLLPNYPNPFNKTTRIEYIVSQNPARVVLDVLNLLGQRVVTLRDEVVFPDVNPYVEMFDPTNISGRSVASGVYIIRLRVGDVSEIRKTVFIR
jgi:hypothetical protein